MIQLTKTFEFAASHRLFRSEWSDEKNFEVFGKCANPNGHGHNYRLEVSVSGEIDPITGMIMDASLLDDIVSERVTKVLDHKNLNTDVPWFEGKITTIETMIEVIWEKLSEGITERDPKAYLSRLKLWETSRIYVTREIQGSVR